MKEITDDSSGANGHSNLRHDADLHQLAQRHYDPQRDTELTTAIVYSVAEARNIPPTDIKSPQLYDVIDLPAIDKAFFRKGSNGGSSVDTGIVEFHYAELLVRIKSDGWIQVYGTNGAEV